MNFAYPKPLSTPCGCPDVFTALAPPGAREMPLYPACCRCGRERDDLTEFYSNPPRPPRLAG